MPLKKNINVPETPRLTDSEERFVKALFESMTALPQADWEQCAETLGLKDAKCAKERWRQISSQRGWNRHKKRLSTNSGPGAISSPASAAVSAGGASSFSAAGAAAVNDGHPGVQTRASRATAAVSSGSGSFEPGTGMNDSASAAMLRHIASVALPAAESANDGTTVKKETRAKRESLKSDSSGSSTYMTCQEDPDSELKADTERASSHRVKEEPDSDDDVVETDHRGVRIKKEKTESREDFNFKDEHEMYKRSKLKKDEPDSDDDHKGGYTAPYIPIGHPAHCMSF